LTVRNLRGYLDHTGHLSQSQNLHGSDWHAPRSVVA
jgi:hypothetical protein